MKAGREDRNHPEADLQANDAQWCTAFVGGARITRYRCPRGIGEADLETKARRRCGECGGAGRYDQSSTFLRQQNVRHHAQSRHRLSCPARGMRHIWRLNRASSLAGVVDRLGPGLRKHDRGGEDRRRFQYRDASFQARCPAAPAKPERAPSRPSDPDQAGRQVACRACRRRAPGRTICANPDPLAGRG
jgi:hypothetical protein